MINIKFYNRIITLLIVFSFFPTGLIFNVDAKTEKVGKIYPYNPEISTERQELQDYIAESLRNFDFSLNIQEYRVKKEDIVNIFRATCFDNPDIFYVDDSYLIFTHSEGYVVRIMPRYTFEYSDIPKYIKKFNKAANSIVNEVNSDWNDYKKALYIHDKLVLNTKYKDGDITYHSAYNVLVKNKGVCEGYSKAYCYLLSKVGIDSKCINSKYMEHCWNLIKLNDNWYHVDVTKDDPLPDTCGYVRHRYFLCSDKYLNNDKSSDKHRKWKDDITYDKEFKCSDTSFDNQVYKKINSQVYFTDKSYYYIDNNYKGKNYSALIKKTGSKKKILKVIKDHWKDAKGNNLYGSFSKMCYFNGSLYFNSNRNIYRLKIKTNKITTAYKLPSFVKKDFYGLCVSDDYIKAGMKKSDVRKGTALNIYKINNKKLLSLPFLRYKSVKLKKGSSLVLKVYKGSGAIKYTTSDKSIAKVNSKGKIKALKKGKCTITVTRNKIKMTCKVNVVK